METNLTSRTLGEIVTTDFRSAGIFESHGLDFCCGGRQTLGEACAAKNLNPEYVISQLRGLDAEVADLGDLSMLEPDALADYIVETHHAYVASAMPRIDAWAKKVADAHGARHPETMRIAEVFAALRTELEQHMFKEEQILFPYVRQIAAEARNTVASAPSRFGTVRNPITMMEMEHENAGRDLAELRRLSNGYTLPADACATFTALYQELVAFERDLHIHIHLENNLLFPNAIVLEERGNV
jgi:regulator of cell morphogenesis and NO signaling